MKRTYTCITFFSYPLILLLLSLSTAYAQKNSPKADFEADILLVKVKAEYRDFFTDTAAVHLLQNFISPVKIISAKKTYPNCTPPTEADHVDLTRVYTVGFSGIEKKDLANLSRLIQGYGYFDYVELKYIQTQHAAFYPNDPGIAAGYQNYLGRMKAYEAWAIEKGDPNLVIGIIDTGVDYTHEDITANIAFNLADPINGIDDDNDGYVDNYQGWDMAGNDNDPNVYYPAFHGAIVAGIAGATVNNGLGHAGIAFNSKILPVKTSVDGTTGAIVAGYEGITYAADHGCKVINLSWGGTNNYSPADQDVIDYAAINKDVLIVAAAGNTDEEANYYPAAYDHVLSVIAMDTIFSASANQYIDVRANFTNWGCCYKATYAHSVDIGAQGMSLYSIRPGNNYTWEDGSSAAAPLVAGAAAIVRSHFPNISALQAAELLRVTADVTDTFPENAPYKEKMGKGRINLYKALTDTKSPAIRYKNLVAVSQFNSTNLFDGDTVSIKADFFNYLRPAANLIVDISSASPDLAIVVNSSTLGFIDSLKSKSNAASPLKLVIKSSQINQQIECRLGYTDPATGYTDYQYFFININPQYTDIYTDNVRTTITSNGRVGYQDLASTIGSGFQKNGMNILYEDGLMIAQASNKVSDCVRANPNGYSNLDFATLSIPSYAESKIKYLETVSSFNDASPTNTYVQGIECIQRSYTFNTTDLKNAVFLEYKIINHSAADIDSIYVGHFIDWDILNYNQNRTGFDVDTRLGYAYDISSPNLFAGVSLLTDQEYNYYAMDNSSVGGTNINPNDGFIDAEKFMALSSKLGRDVAGGNSGGNDISMTLGGRINHLKQGDTVVIAFALMAESQLLNLKTLAAAAKAKFIEIHTGPTPAADSYKLCTNATVDLNIQPTPGNIFNFYTTDPATNASPVSQGKSYTLTNVSAADTIYISNVDSLYESAATKYIITSGEAPVSEFSMSAQPALNPSAFTNESIRYQSLLWNFGDGATSTDENPEHIYTLAGTYTVTLKASDNLACIDSLKQTIVIGDPLDVVKGNTSGIQVYPNPVGDFLFIDLKTTTKNSADIAIFNALGQLTKNENVILSNSILQLNVSDLSSGLYFIELKDTGTLLRFVK